MEMVDVIMNLTSSTENDFTTAAEVLEEIGFVVGQKLIERYIFWYLFKTYLIELKKEKSERNFLTFQTHLPLHQIL